MKEPNDFIGVCLEKRMTPSSGPLQTQKVASFSLSHQQFQIMILILRRLNYLFDFL